MIPLAGKPVIVGGAGARGVVASCTYEARACTGCIRPCRPCGPASCVPQAIFLSGRHGRYAEVSGDPQALADSRPWSSRSASTRRSWTWSARCGCSGHPRPSPRPAPPGPRPSCTWSAPSASDARKMIAKLASRAAKPRASRAGLEPGPGVFLIEPGRGARIPPRPSRSRRCGVSGPPRRRACTIWACARWATWPRCPSTPWCAASARPAGPSGRAVPRRGSRSRHPEPPRQVDRARGDLQPGPRRPARARSATCCAWPSRWPPCCAAPRARPGRSP